MRRMAEWIERQARLRPRLGALRWLQRALGRNRIACKDRGGCDVSRAFLYGCDIEVEGEGAKLLLDAGVRLSNVRIRVSGQGCKVELATDVRMDGGVIAALGSGSRVVIGEDTTIVSAELSALEGTSVRVGRDCMLAYDIDMRSGDSHSLLRLDGGDRLNPACDVVVGDHVWIGLGAQVLKGVTVGSGAVVAARAVVCKDVASQSVVGGNPARSIREGVQWERNCH